MNHAELLRLRQYQHLTLDALRGVEPQLAEAVDAELRESARTRVLAAIPPAAAELRERVAALDLGGIRPDAVRARIFETLGDSAEELRRLGVERTATDPLRTTEFTASALATDPDTFKLLERAKLIEVATIAGVSIAAVDRIANDVIGPSGLSESVFQNLVAQGKLSYPEAVPLGDVHVLYELAGEDRQLTAALYAEPQNNVRQLAALDAAGWRELLDRRGIPTPEGTTREEYATALSRRFAAFVPDAAFMRRLPRVDERLMPAATDIQPLLGRYPNALDVDLSTLDLSAYNAEEIRRFTEAHRTLRAAALSYPGFGLTAILQDTTRSPFDRINLAGQRLAILQRTFETLAEGDLLELDLSPGSPDLRHLHFEQTGATPEEQRMITETVRAYQRTYSLTQDVDDAHRLLGAGYGSSVQVATKRLADFEANARVTNAEAYWKDARGKLIDTTLAAASMIDLQYGFFGDLTFGNVPPSTHAFLRKLEGYDSLFGNLAFCTCEHCQSILGPAAYFVDLMHFLDEHIRPQFKGKTTHPLDLKVRRPDLWTLELSCENTNTRIPTLDIVNEVLENYIARDRGYGGPLTDRAAVRTKVYTDNLASATNSFVQPFHLPLTRIDLYLGKLDSTRAAVARALGATTQTVAAAELSLSPAEWTLVTQRELDLPDLSKLYDVAFAVAGSGVAPVDAQLIVNSTGLKREELGELVATRFVAAGGATVVIRAEKRNSDSVQNDIENVHGLTADALDRMHRFTRVWRRLPWSIPELDRVLTALADTTLDPQGLAAVRDLQRRLGTSVDETIALFAEIPQRPERASLLDRLFHPAGTATADRFPQATARFVHPAFRTNTTVPADRLLPRLVAGIGVDQATLGTLIRRLAAFLERGDGTYLNPDATNEEDRYFVLTARNLSLLYRHALLARVLGLSVADLFQLIEHAAIGGRVLTLTDLRNLLDFHAWWKSSGYSLDDLSVAAGRTPRDASRYPDPMPLAASIVHDAVEGLSFTDTVFAAALGVTEKASRDLIAANLTVIESAGAGRYRLVAGIDIATVNLSIPTSATVPVPPSGSRSIVPDEARMVLSAYEPAAVLARALGAALRFDTLKVEAIARLAGQSLKSDPIARAMRGETTPNAVEQLITAIRPHVVALQAREWDGPAIDFLRQQPARFGFTPPTFSTTTLRALSLYTALARRRTGTAADAPLVSAADIRAVLLAFNAGGPDFPTSATDTLARVLGVDSGLVAGLRGRITLPATAAHALEVLDRAAALGAALGLDGEALSALIRSDNASLERGADALLAAIRARYPEETERAKQLSLVEEPLREKQRDALVAWLLHSQSPRVFQSTNDLFAYFLIDVETGGCSTTSRVVSATGSVQIYVHRILLNLEQTGDGALDPLVLTLPSLAASEWTWRKNYRVWEANRKVFLWPENYIEPDLRDDKTPLFRELEDELLQTSLSDQDVLDAYTKYMKGFEELASLTIAGAYHDLRTTPEGTVDVLHLFGAASTNPPTYYYRTGQNLIASGRDPKQGAVWTPWKKIDVQISSRQVGPVVFRGRLHLFWADFKTRPFNVVRSGGSEFAGYRHVMSLHYTMLRPDGSWTPPQDVELPSSNFFGPSRGMIQDDLSGSTPDFETTGRLHPEPLDDYTLDGVNWLGVWPDVVRSGAAGDQSLVLRLRNFHQPGRVDLFRRRFIMSPSSAPAGRPALLVEQGNRLKFGIPWFAYLLGWNGSAIANLLADDARGTVYYHQFGLGRFLDPTISGDLATVPAETHILALTGSVEDAILQIGPDVLLLQGSFTSDDRYVLRRIGTTLSEDVSYKLFVDGVDGLLHTTTQTALREAPVPLTAMTSRVIDRLVSGKIDFSGAYGVYYREIFFHVPFLIANALNARGEFASAQRWYHHIFDPAASEVIDTTGLTGEEKKRRALDRVWRYIELRNLGLPKLREMLTDENALAVYRRDPFNPHAIARLRLSAYQKSIVMKYVDNILDWADHLLTQFTMESVGEALMLYILASDILGRRPAKLGDCGEGAVTPKNYETISATLGKGEEVLIELETWIYGSKKTKWTLPKNIKGQFAYDRTHILRAIELRPLVKPPQVPFAGEGPNVDAGHVAFDGIDLAFNPNVANAPKNVGGEARGVFLGSEWNDSRVGNWGPQLSGSMRKTENVFGRGEGPRDRHDVVENRFGRVNDHRGHFDISEWIGSYGWSIVRQIGPVFCIPANKDLLAYWDRVEDRLFKIRHCMDIHGTKRELALFAPEIDPRLLVRMRAAGLTLDDVLGATSGNLPPYRFLFLVDRAKAFAGTLSSFGAALLAALEKKDAEELNRLRMVQQQNLTRMSTQLRRWEIEISEESLQSVERQLEAATYRRDYYQALVQQNRTPAEMAESVLRHTVSAIQVTETAIDMAAAISALIPDVGSPFAMKYGGTQVSGSLAKFGNSIHAAAQGIGAIATSVGIEATFDRRAEGWRHQQALAEHDIANLERQREAARIRLEIAERSLEIHEKSIEQMDEMLELMDGKFSNLGLYTWLSTQMRRLYRDAYQNALALAKLAEQAFRFERGDDTLPGLTYNYWDATHAGLLAGEQLLVELQSLERRYLETNYRGLEIDQPFALSQIAPDALLALREEGECRFRISEAFFDLFYPGHFKRRIKAVRLTIPSITGPYVNVSATLTLDKSWVRLTPAVPGTLTEIPPRRSVSVATSTAQNDAGVFELSFRDERYMPFEGAGAVSEWVLSLPKTFRQFDYQTINDVIVSVSYTAEHDGARRAIVEQDNAAIEGSLRKYLSTNSVGRLFSLRQEFSSAFSQLLHSPAATPVRFEITSRHFPLVVGTRALAVQKAVLLLKLASGATAGAFALTVDGGAVSGFPIDPTLGDLPASALPGAFGTNLRSVHTVTLTNPGNLAPSAPPPGDPSALDADKLLDVLLYVEYRLAP
ncbi:MAG TPA: neuraminidase-like domain-containing protein [Thermoanaerobaculia bacterium]